MSSETKFALDDDFLDSLSDDPKEALLQLIEAGLDFHRRLPSEEELENHATYLEYIIAIEEFCAQHSMEFTTVNLDGSASSNISDIVQTFTYLEAVLREEVRQAKAHRLEIRLRSRFQGRFGGFHYEFTESEVARVQELINELRTEITDSTDYDDQHKRRLLKRLEHLQAEIHKRTSNIDALWGLLGDAGVALGKFGRDAKPIVDRIREVAEIAWKVQSRAEGLLESTTFPLLGRQAPAVKVDEECE